MQISESTSRRSAAGRIQLFEYPAGPYEPSLPDWSGLRDEEEQETDDAASAARSAEAREAAAREHAAVEQRIGEEARRSFEAGRERGVQEGREAERQSRAASEAESERERMRQAAELIESFAAERDHYLRAVEHEVVKLALAVSARILRREAQMDPLLLTGAVRVALGQLSGSTEARLLVPAGELKLWTETIALMPRLAVRPSVVAGDEMRLGDCRIETGLGTVDLGIRSQLSEIERGFFDRAPGAGASEADAPLNEIAYLDRESR